MVKPNANFASDPSIEVTATSAWNVRYAAFNHDQKRHVEGQFTLPDQFDSSDQTMDVYFN